MFLNVHRVAALPGLIVLIGLAAACSTPAPAPQTAAPVTQAAPVKLCTLNEVDQSFICDMEFDVMAGSTCASGPGLDLEHEFLTRMTAISIQMLYLEGEQGAQPPFRYNSPGDVYARIQKNDCRSHDGQCMCRFTYQDPELLQVFYHSAGCRRSSPLSGNPLYFRGRGCY